MPVANTSRQAFHEQREKNLTQERSLFLYLRKAGPVSDRQIAAFFGWVPSHAAARRNGLAARLREADGWELYEAGKERDATTAKRVTVWGVRQTAPEKTEQGALFP